MGYQLFPPKTGRRKLSAPVSFYLASAAKQLANGSYKCSWKMSVEVKERSGPQECRICSEKISKNILFFLTKTRGIFFSKKLSQQSAQLNGVLCISAKAFPSSLSRQDLKIKPLPAKNIRKLIFFPENSRKKMASQTLEFDESWTRRSVYTKVG